MFGSVIFGEGPFGGPLPPWRRVVEAGVAITAGGEAEFVGGSIAQGIGHITADADVVARPVAIAQSSPQITAQIEIYAPTLATEQPAQIVVNPPNLAPLRASHEADDLEAELKALFISLFETHIRPDERFINVLGMPQHGPRSLVEQSLAADGLSIYRGADVASGAGAYLLRAWRAMNPKRGMHLLETYLQLLWPNVWTADQMWQVAASAYPTALHKTEAAGRFLTSRVEVTLPARVTTGGDVNAISSGLRASLPARMLMKMTIVEESTFGVGIANVYYAGAAVASFEGSFT